MNNKIIVVVVIAVLLGAGVGIFFMTNGNNGNNRPVLDEELQVYGNANQDWKVDSNDISFLKRIISGAEKETKFADANRDGVINEKDIDQVQGLINNTAKFIWLMDGDGHNKKINRDISRIGCEYYSNTELMLILGQRDKIVAIDNAPYQTKDFYFGNNSDVVNLVNMNNPDYEKVEKMNLDVLLTFSYSGTEAKQEKLPDVDVIYLGMYRPNVQEPTKSEYFQGILKAGYIFGAVDRAEAYMGWLLDIRDTINGKTSKIVESEKSRVLMTNYSNSYFQTGVDSTLWSVYTSIDPMVQACLLAGGHPVAKDILTDEQYNGGANRTMYGVKVAPEKIVAAKIDNVFCHCVKYTYGGTVVNGPDHGYGISDHTQMDKAYETACGRDLVHIDKISIIAGDFRNGASGCMLLAAYMAKVLYPDMFKDMDPLAYHQEYVTKWMGIPDYDIRTDAVFISPSITA